MKNTRRASVNSSISTALLALLGAFGAGCGKEAKLAPPVVKLTDTANMDAEVVSVIGDYVARAEAAPTDFAVRGELGLAYEANMMFSEAERTYAQTAEMAASDPDAEDKVDQQWRYREAIMKRRNGDLEGALEMMQGVSEAYTRSDFIWIRLGDFLAEADRIDEAEAAYKRAIELAPQNPYGAERLGRLYVSSDRAEEAVPLLEEVVDTNPDYAAAHYALGQAYQAVGREDEARSELQRGVDSIPGFPIDPHSKQLTTLGAGFGLRMGRIERMLTQRQAEPAIEELTEILKDRPEDKFVLNLMARAHVVKGDPATAIEWVQKSIDLNPKAPDAHLLMSEYQIYAGDNEKALEHALIAGELAPTLGMVDYRKGIALLSSERLEEAIETLLLAEEKGCQDPGLFLTLAQAYGVQQLFGESQKYGKLAAGKMPQSLIAQLTLCQSSMGLNDLETARSALEAARKVAPYDAGVIQLDNVLKQMEEAQ